MSAPHRIAVQWLLAGWIWLTAGFAMGGAAPVNRPAAPAPTLGPDPAVVVGQLPNGLRYAVRAQPMPPGRLSLCLYVAAGSRHEEEGEHGYAHFVEHLAFAGSRDFPGDGAIRALQRFGLAFGSEVNAATGRNYTSYEIRNLPVQDPAAFDTALRVLRNFAESVAFEPAAVERERGVILAERNVRSGRISYWWGRELEFLSPYLEYVHDDEFAAVYGETPLGRSQLGTPRSLRRATAERLRAFYRRWYRPENLVLAVAGDGDPRQLAAAIVEAFGTLPVPPAPAPTAPAIVVPAVTGANRTVVFPNTLAPMETVALVAGVPRRGSDPVARARDQLVETLAQQMTEQRLVRTVKVPAQVESVLGHEVPGWTTAAVRLRTAPGDWLTAAAALELELRRLRDFGFSADELAEAIESRRRRLAGFDRDAPTRPAREVAPALAHAVATDLMLPSAAAECRWAEARFATIDPAECQAALRRLWPEDAVRLVLSGPIVHEQANSADAHRVLDSARLMPLAPSTPPSVRTEAAPEERFGMLGHVAGEERDAALDCWAVQYDNGVRLNFKTTTFEPGKVRVRVNFGYGLLGTEPGREGLAYAIALLYYGGTVSLTPEQVRDALERNAIDGSFSVGADRLGFAATCPAASLETALRLFAAHLVKPGFRPAGATRARAFVEGQLARTDRTASAVADDRLREHLFGGHHALMRPRRTETGQLTEDDLRGWLEPQLETSPVEVTIVGDVGLDEATTAVARTFGALPLRSTVDPMAERRAYTPGATPQRIEARFAGAANVASVALAWRLPDVVGQEDDCRLQLLAGVLEDRVRGRLRREMGKTYSPAVALQADRALMPALLYVRCRVETEPRQLERVAAAAKAVVAELVRDGPTADELERARQPLIRAAEDNAVSNAWWLQVLGEAQSKPQFLAGQGERVQILRAATTEELAALARLLFAPERLCEVRALPQ